MMKQQLQRLHFANNFTILCFFALFLPPSVLEAQISGKTFQDFYADGSLSKTTALKSLTMGRYRQNDHTSDFGFYNSTTSCFINLTTNISGCYDSNGNTAGGSSVATVQVIVDWGNAPSGETINVTCTGATAQSINPATSPKPAVLNFTVPANGSNITITATFSTTMTCTASESVTSPAGNCTLEPCTAGNTGGMVWRDFNNDGVKDANETAAVGGVIVKAFDCNGNLVETDTTDYLGQYTFTTLTPSATNKYRLEFSNLPPQYKPTFNGTNGRTDVQFITAASCSVHYGVNYPMDYCQANPDLAIACYVAGVPAAGEHVLVKFAYNNSGDTPAPTTVANADEIGAVWGVAYARATKQLYEATFLKRHVGLLNNKLGVIYKTDMGLATPTSTAWLDVTAAPLSINVGQASVPTNAVRGLTDKLTNSTDSTVFRLVNKVGLGDIDVSDDETTIILSIFSIKNSMLLILPRRL